MLYMLLDTRSDWDTYFQIIIVKLNWYSIKYPTKLYLNKIFKCEIVYLRHNCIATILICEITRR